MTAPDRPEAAPSPDAASRRAAIAARDVNVIIDAGAGTGKTTLLIDRLVQLVAPDDDTTAALSLDRIAAVTFTRKAAGELELRVRERLLSELASERHTPNRRLRLLAALGAADTAFIGTIHSFADRLLRLRPVEANLSPSYEVVDDEQPLVLETTDILVRAAQEGTLASQLAGTGLEDRAAETADAILMALRSGIKQHTRVTHFAERHGLDGLVAGFVQRRDTPPEPPELRPFDLTAFRDAAAEYLASAATSTGDSPGEKWLRRGSRALERVAGENDPVVIAAALQPFFGRKDAPRKRDCGGNPDTWRAIKAWSGGTGQDPVRATPLRDDLWAPIDEWRAARLVRIFPVVIALHEKVKARRRTVDQLDLLLQLRDLLRGDLTARAYYQRLFDHIFVDEFQDTDPLQVEILLYLCERDARAATWSDVDLAPGKLTIVGDPKQSIYRFRRADVAMYADARARIAASPSVETTLTTNFRSSASLIAWINDRFDHILGVPPSPPAAPAPLAPSPREAGGGSGWGAATAHFDPATGTVYNQRLIAAAPEPATPRVHVLPIVPADGSDTTADTLRALEATAVAHYVRHLTEVACPDITDPLTGERRPVSLGDIAILAVSTYTLDPLLRALDDLGVPHATRGGRLFLEDPLHQQFLLALRAISDPDDGIAQATLLRPPFFALTPEDLLSGTLSPPAASSGSGTLSPPQAGGGLGGGSGSLADDARALLRDLRRHRHTRPVGATARDLIDRTALGRAVALGPNGAQRLARLRELCLLAERISLTDNLDFDATTATLRTWVTSPIQLDPPTTLAGEALQVITIHQAKGLEYPVVILWDGRCQWTTRDEHPAWWTTRDATSWSIHIEGLHWEHPRTAGLRDREQAFRDAERRRVIYVAATRARELLVLPRNGKQTDQFICAQLLADPPAGLTVELEPHVESRGAPWSTATARPPQPTLTFAAASDPIAATAWPAAAAAAATPQLAPIAITTAARAASPPQAAPAQAAHSETLPPLATGELGGGSAPIDPAAPSPPRRHESRFGPLFGTTVHRSIGAALRHPDRPIAALVTREAAHLGLTDHLPDAIADVERTLATLATLGLRHPPGPTLRLEYPIAAPGADGTLLLGFIDLVATENGTAFVLDFKTDTVPPGLPPSRYTAQIKTYATLLPTARTVRAGLLFTADGLIRWSS